MSLQVRIVGHINYGHRILRSDSSKVFSQPIAGHRVLLRLPEMWIVAHVFHGGELVACADDASSSLPPSGAVSRSLGAVISCPVAGFPLSGLG